MAYRFLVDQTVLDVFEHAEPDERSRLLAAFRSLAASPEQPWDFSERGGSGRDFRANFVGNWLVRYWIDSPVKTGVIVDIRWT